MKKSLISVLKLVAVVMAAAAAVCAVVAFWDQIMDLVDNISDKLEEKRADQCCDAEEFDDFADYDDSIM